jgi:hypothetical protein
LFDEYDTQQPIARQPSIDFKSLAIAVCLLDDRPLITIERALSLGWLRFWLSFLVVCIIAAFNAAPAQCDEIEGLRAAVESAKRSHICPPSAEYPILEFATFCKKMCERSVSCDGTKATDPCENGDKEGCHQLAEETHACLSEMNAKNKTILEYNSIVEKCQRGQEETKKDASRFEPKKDASRFESKPAYDRNLVKELQEAASRAERSKQSAQQAAANGIGEKSLTEDEKKRLKAESVKLASWCEGMVQACYRRAASFDNADKQTHDLCNAYCQTLQIEDCNPSSATVRGAADACAAKSEVYQRSRIQETEEEDARIRQLGQETAERFLRDHPLRPEQTEPMETYQPSSPVYSNNPLPRNQPAPVPLRPIPPPYRPPVQQPQAAPSHPSCSQTTGQTCADR